MNEAVESFKKRMDSNFSLPMVFGQGSGYTSLVRITLIFLLSISVALADVAKEKPPTFGRYFPKFKELCTEIFADGRGEEFNLILSPLAEISVNDCLGCKNFYRGFISSCRVGGAVTKKSKKAKKVTKTEEEQEQPVAAEEEGGDGEVAPTPTPKPIIFKMPSFETINSASALATQIREDTEAENAMPEIINNLKMKLEGSGEKGNEYFYTLSKYLTDPALAH